MIDIEETRKKFPILNRTKNGQNLIYLDSAATSQKPIEVINSVINYYSSYNSNIHRGLYDISEKTTEAYEEVRKKTAKFINSEYEEIVFTRNATESINLIAYSWGRKNITKGQNIVVSIMEHHSNMLPWQVLCKEKGAEIRYIDINNDGTLDMDHFETLLDEHTALVAVSHISNSLGTINPIDKIIKAAHKHHAKIVLDACQSAPHRSLNVKTLDIDFLVFSGHKMLAPTGIGVLFARQDLLEEMDPFLTGGGMINDVDINSFNSTDVPWKFEAGTPNIEGVIGLGAAIDFLESVGLDNIEEYTKQLLEYAILEFKKLDFINTYGPLDINKQASILSFNIANIHAHDVAQVLNEFGICIRAGQHCTNPLMKKLDIPSTARASFYLYNTKEEIIELIKALKHVNELFK